MELSRAKWDVHEGDVYEGDTDDNGRYVVHVDLTDDHDELADNDYQRFRDLRLAAYFIDASTRRTEQRRFDVRISKEPVHVYIIEDSYRLVSSGLPVEFFISTRLCHPRCTKLWGRCARRTSVY